MKLSIDATGLGQVKTGTAVYLTEILRVWNRTPTPDHHFVIFASPKTADYLQALQLDQRFSFVSAPDSRALRILWQQTALPWHLSRLGIDVHWGSGFILPLLGRPPMAVTIHDLTFQLFPALHETIKRHYFPAMIAAAVKKAKCIIAISQSTRTDLHRLLPASRGKTEVTLLAPREFSGPAAKARPAGRDLLCLGTLEPRKNLDRLLEAWLSLAESDKRGSRLVVVGMQGWMVERLLERHRNGDASLEFTGFLDDDALHRRLTGARALVYPSIYEGFGLPVIEAMALGIPVLTSNVGATREVAGDAALLVDPLDTGAIRDGLRRLLDDDAFCGQLAERGKKRASEFSWEETATQTLRILEGIARRPAAQ